MSSMRWHKDGFTFIRSARLMKDSTCSQVKRKPVERHRSTRRRHGGYEIWRSVLRLLPHLLTMELRAPESPHKQEGSPNHGPLPAFHHPLKPLTPPDPQPPLRRKHKPMP